MAYPSANLTICFSMRKIGIEMVLTLTLESSHPQEFRRMSSSGYLLNGEQDNFYYMSLSRLHPQRIQAAKRLSESTVNPEEVGWNSMIGQNSQPTNHSPDVDDSARAPSNHGTPGRRPDHEAEVARVEPDSEVCQTFGGRGSFNLTN